MNFTSHVMPYGIMMQFVREIDEHVAYGHNCLLTNVIGNHYQVKILDITEEEHEIAERAEKHVMRPGNW